MLLQQLTEVRIMSKAWSEKNNVVKPQNFTSKEETFAIRNTNGTGPYMLKSREADVRTVLVEQPELVGQARRQRDRDRLPADQGRTRRASRRCSRARSTSSSTRRCRTWRG